VHDRSPIPDAGWITVRDEDYEALLAAEAAADSHGQVSAGDSEPEHTFVRVTGALYECPTCARIMWMKPGGATFRIFELVTNPD